jgi:sec-independent protein translocase protein TatA
MGNLGWGEILAIGVIALLLFGPSRLPEMGKAAGDAINQFKKAVNPQAPAAPAADPVSKPSRSRARKPSKKRK